MKMILLAAIVTLFTASGVSAEGCFFRAQVRSTDDSDKEKSVIVVSYPPRFYVKLKVTEVVEGSSCFKKDVEVIFYVHSPVLTLGSASEDLKIKNNKDYLFLYTESRSDSGSINYTLARGEYLYKEYLKNQENQTVDTTAVSAPR